MQRGLSAAFLVVSITGCSNTEVPPGRSFFATIASALTPANAAAGERVVQPGSNAAVPQLAFTITRVYAQEKLIERAPWHASAGDWTFFDAAAGGAQFTFGFVLHRRVESSPFRMGDAVIAVPTPADGASLAQALARRFQVMLPPEGQGGPVHALRFSAAVLGSGMARSPNGGFSGTGTWYACKWFLSGGNAEVFFNFSLAERHGEWLEKDEDYDKDVAAVLARGLRDGVTKLVKQ